MLLYEICGLVSMERPLWREDGSTSKFEDTLQLIVSQSVSMCWHRAPLWDLRPEITSCPNVAV
jgi:hypothetical protein